MPCAYLVAYDGLLFHGAVGSENSVVRFLEKAFRCRTMIASRTDPGVMALRNVAFPTCGVCLHIGDLASRLPQGIFPVGVAYVDAGFIPRRADRRIYVYVAPYTGEDTSQIERAAALLSGRHDFRNFMVRRGQKASTIATVQISVHVDSGVLLFTFKGRGFKNKMLRKLAWALLAVGRGVWTVDDLLRRLDTSAEMPTPSAPALGLILVDVHYNDIVFDVANEFMERAYKYFTKKVTESMTRLLVYKLVNIYIGP